jgi:hypothetical protein
MDGRCVVGWWGPLLVAATLTACAKRPGNGDTAASDTAAPAARDSVAAPARSEPVAAKADSAAARAQGDSVVRLLETGCGGGVTGGGGGTFLTADGRFYRFERNGPPPNAKRELTFVRKDSSRAAALVQAAERAGLTRVKYSMPANMSCHLTLERDGKTYEVVWPFGAKPAELRQLMAVAADLDAAAAR